MRIKTGACLLTILLGLGSYFGAEGAEPASAPLEVSALASTVLPVDNCYYICESCEDPDYHEIDTSLNELPEREGDHPEVCSDNPLGSCGTHDYCFNFTNLENPMQDPAFWLALDSADGLTLKAFLANNSQVARYNEARGSIQLMGCSGAVVGNVPLHDSQIRGLNN